MKLSIVIPAYNEEKTLSRVLNKVESAFVFGLDKEIIIIDDGSSDLTKEILKNLESKYKILYHPRNLGKGAAIRTGFKQATGDIILVQDADLELSPDDYPLLLKPILDKKTKVVFGSRTVTDNPYLFTSYYLGGKVISRLVQLLYGTYLSDVYVGYKAFNKEVLDKLNLKSSGFEIEAELAVKTLKQKEPIAEVAISYNPRTRAEGKKINWKDGAKAISTIIKYRFVD